MTLADVIARVESRNNSFAMRFEPAKFQELVHSVNPDTLRLLHTIAQANRCNFNTAAMIAATSWGRYQIMGENLYSICRYTGTIAAYLNGLSQSTTFVAFCAAHEIGSDDVLTHADAMVRFATIYNGPANVASYVSDMQQAIRELTAT